MKILLDECMPVSFRRSLPGHDVHTAEWAGFKGMKNGRLLRAAEAAGYDVVLTADQGIPYQQGPSNRLISILVLVSATNKIEDLLPFVPSVQEELAKLRKGLTIVVR